ncbi:MAG: putative bifunctional diguanylate cyclase/phosphodiesterase [Acidimicrobiales bacterium]
MALHLSRRQALASGGDPGRAFGWWYFGTLVGLTLLTLGAHTLIGRVADVAIGGSEAIMIAGREHTLSQRVAVHAIAYVTGPVGGRQVAQDELSESIGEMRLQHDQLLEESAGPSMAATSRGLDELYYGTDGLDLWVHQYLELAQTIVDDPDITPGDPRVHALVVQASADGPTTLLGRLEATEALYQQRTAGAVVHAQRVADIMLGVTLLLLALEAVFVLRPMIQQLRRRNQQLNSSRHRLQSILDNALVGVLAVTHDGLIVDSNRGARVMLGRTQSDLDQTRLGDLAIDADGREVVAEALAAAGRGLQHEVHDFRLRARGGSLNVRMGVGGNTSDELITVVFSDITEQRRVERQLSHAARHDKLTGLPNRTMFMERVQDAIDHSTADALPVIVQLDIDDFKTVVDSLGHAVGDEALRRLAAELTRGLRSDDTVARLSGDEFAVLATDVDPGDAGAIGLLTDRIQAAVLAIQSASGHDLRLTASLGVAVSNGHDTADHVLRQADTATYEAKRCGKNQWRMFRPELQHDAIRRLELRTDLDRALADDQLALAYQPIVELATGRAVGAESLLRWPHPVQGFIPPGEFIPVAENTGQIRALGHWVLNRAAAEMPEAVAASGNPDFYMSVNVSAQQLAEADFVSRVETTFGPLLGSHRLVIELTETSLSADPDQAIATLTAVRRLGALVALDDFGTGYSSMATLSNFPIDLVKLDRSFVTGLHASERRRAMVAAVLDLARALGFKVIAEGIENEVERNTLVDLGCRYGQGYLFAKPGSIADLAAYRRPVGGS